MEEIDKDLLKALYEHLKRLYERYKNYTKVFTSIHIGLAARVDRYQLVLPMQIAPSATGSLVHSHSSYPADPEAFLS